MRAFYEKQVLEHFEKKKNFSREELFNFYSTFEPELKEGTFGWRIYDLKRKNIIQSVGKGIYTICKTPSYLPTLSKTSERLAKLLFKGFSDIGHCVWETSWLNEFSNHQAITNFIIVEVEKELVDSVFYYLKDNNIKDLFLQPDEKEMEKYVIEKENPVVLKCLITRSPVQKVKDKKLQINVPQLEKILVDLYCDRDIFYFYAGKELENIFENAIDRYPIDFSRLLNYAKRRGKGPEIEEFISKKLSYSLDEILR